MTRSHTMNVFERFFNLSLDIFIITNLDGVIKHINTAFIHSLGWSEEEIQETPCMELIHPDDRRDFTSVLGNLRMGHSVFLLATRLLHKNGAYKNIHWRMHPDLETDLLYGIGHEYERSVDMPQTFYEHIAEASPSGVIIVSESGNILFSNQQASRMFGYEKNLQGLPIEQLIPQRFEKAHLNHRNKYNQNPQLRPMGIGRELTAIRKDGSEFTVEIGLNPIDTQQGRIVICSIVDISVEAKIKRSIYEKNTQLEEEKRILEHQAYTDSLTALPNRRGLQTELAYHLKRASDLSSNLSAILIDIDHFKEVNDMHGHLEGDKILEILGRLLDQISRKKDYAARFGGEEFIIILPDTNSDEAIQIASRIHDKIVNYDWPLKKITVSMGISTIKMPQTSTLASIGDKLISAADQALYYSKNNGRNQVTHFDKIKSIQ